MKKTVLGSVLALAVSIALLAGATFAWFTDSIVNSGNTITAGTLKINAYAFDCDDEATGTEYTIDEVNGGKPFKFSATGRDLSSESEKVIEEEKWEPGKSSAKLLQVANGGSLAAKVKLDFTTSGALTDVLWFDFIQVEGGKIAGTFTKRPMNELAELAKNREFQLKEKEKVEYIFVYGMNEDANNDYQGKTFTVDVAILAKQAAVEEDGFGNPDYDAEAEYDRTVQYATAENFAAVLQNAEAGAEICLTENVNNLNITLTDPQITIDLGGNTVTGRIALEQKIAEGTVVLKNGTLQSDGNYSPLYFADYAEGGKLEIVLEEMVITNPQSGAYPEGSFLYAVDSFGIYAIKMLDCTVTGSLNFTDAGAVTIEGGEFTAVADGGDKALFYLNNGNVTVDNAVLNCNGLSLCDPADYQPTLNDTKVNE